MATRAIGLDIGTHAVRAVELTAGRGQPVIRRMAQVALPHGAVVSGEVVDPAAVSVALRRLWREGGFRHRSVVLGVANSRVVARMADLPAMTEDELRSSIGYQVQDLVPMPIEEAELDFQIIDREVVVDGSPRVRVLLVAAHREMITNLLDAVSGAGLNAERIDLIPLALIRATQDPVGWLHADDLGSHEVIIGSGAGVTNVVVHQRGIPQFVRTLPTGGEAVTDALARDLGLDADDAESVKRGSGEGSFAADQPHVDEVAVDALTPLALEVAGSLDFHLAQDEENKLRRVIISGGGSRLTALRTLLEDQVGVPVVEADPYAGLDVSRVGLDPAVVARNADYFAVAIGLALSVLPSEARERRITLLPQAAAVRRAERQKVVLAGAGVVALVAGLGGLSVMRSSDLDGARLDAQASEAEAAGLQAETAAYQDVLRLEGDVAQQERTVEVALDGDVAWSPLLRQVSGALPRDVWITTLNVTAGTAIVPGTFQISATGTDHTSTARWLQQADALPVLDEVWLTSSAKTSIGTGATVAQFSANASLTPAAGSARAARYLEVGQ